jgi:choline/glycine/proline betaine transport protein
MKLGRFQLRIDPVVFFTSAGLIAAFVVFGAVWTETAAAVFETVQSFIVVRAGWLYALAVAAFLGFALFLLVSPFGGIRLGADDEEPEFATGSWFAMLFSAGMGIGLLFYSVAEPVLHFASPPTGAGGTEEAVGRAMEITFFHWGLHAWAIYVVVGLSLAYFSFRHDLPLTLRSALYPILGDRIHGRAGEAIDTLAVLGTLFGVATSLGLGVMQVNAGLGYLFDVPFATWVQLLLITGITALATLSVVLGVDRGIRRLSELNLGLGLILVLFVFITGPTTLLLDAFVADFGAYLSGMVENTFRTAARGDSEWLGSWTFFYWGWWIAWSPFVGMFIARISRGRTIREFVLGVLFVPPLLAFFWITVFGETALHMEMSGGGGIVAAVQESIPTALFVVLDRLPLAQVSSLVATLVVVTFFVTSSDSGSLVIDIITAGGDPDPPVPQRIFWAVSEGAVAAVLLVAGGLKALQTAAITSALPFAVALMLVCWGLYRGLRAERRAGRGARRGSSGTVVAASVSSPSAPQEEWHERVGQVLERAKREPAPATRRHRIRLELFLERTAVPALAAVRDALRSHGRDAVVEREPDGAALSLRDARGEEAFRYEVRLTRARRMSAAFPEIERDRPDGAPTERATVFVDGERRRGDVSERTRRQLSHHLVEEMGARLAWDRPVRPKTDGGGGQG